MIRMMRKDRKPIKPLEQFQRKAPRRRPFNLANYPCKKCGMLQRARSTTRVKTYFYCPNPECDGSEVVSRNR